MGELFGPLARGIGVYALTNVDDVIGVTALFMTARACGHPRRWQVWAGEYIAFAVLLGLAVLAAVSLRAIPDQWIGAIGLVPVTIGVRRLVRAARSRGEVPPARTAAGGLAAVVAVAIGSGVDSTPIYTMAFRTLGRGASIATAAGFVIGVALCCLVGNLIGTHRRVLEVVQRLGPWAVPVIFISIGVFILVETGFVAQLVRLLAGLGN